MPIIPTIGRRSPKLRLLIISVYTVLILGSVTTVFPFLMMLSIASTSKTDFEEYTVPPRYVYNDRMLLAKYLDEKHKAENFDAMKFRYQFEEPFEETVGGEQVWRWYGRTKDMRKVLSDHNLADPKLKLRVADWNEFKASLPMKYKDTYFHHGTFPIGESEVAFQEYLQKKYPTIPELRKALQEEPTSHIDIQMPYDAYDRHAWYPPPNGRAQEWVICRDQLPLYMMNVVTTKPLYQKFLLDRYEKKIAALNQVWGTDYKYFWQMPFAWTKPEDASGADWEAFVRTRMPMRYARLDTELCRESYVAFLKQRFGTVTKYNGQMNDTAPSLEEATLSEHMPESSLTLWLWQEYYEKAAPIEGILIDSADMRYAKYLEDKYGSVEAANEAYGTDFASLATAEPPWKLEDYFDLFARKWEIRKEYLLRNYAYVLKRVFLMGRPLLNTFILVTLVVFTQVTVNPLAAYALSRYRLRYTAKVLIFMLATMAFPAEVAMIPNFLMIRDLGMLNTFAALVLPGLANGYFVFLLKGFFDSLPQELYESASIDGASELRMFWTITLPLSLPVLSVIALFAFGGAYGSFLWAFTSCQDRKMWTLMVFLQQFQQEAGVSCPYLVMASLVLAAIPTIIVFLSAQKVLMKGIVVPTMK